ncbi:13kDa GIY-YIG-like endonuclease [Heliothis virescens ascovirus 3j]|uniref:13kDa GIY-YIG-like endonuclease n=2 Tax=unclassified Ascovirus TaxID=328613 RepID=A0A2Z5UZD0_9VIRU|nr:GIY-YIG-like endonuclease [Heliothis virescens ascovirus 3h]BBB16522.1 13kDa GIY-YIG-like endonuclease [Heliothis virescens ascovirus 3j]
MAQSDYKLYMIRMKNGNLYTGISNDVEKRFKTHCSGKGAKCLRGATELELVWRSDESFTKSEALSLEYRIKHRCDKHTKLLIVYCQPKNLRCFLEMTPTQRSGLLKAKVA